MKQILFFLHAYWDGFKTFNKHISGLVNAAFLTLTYFTGVGLTALVAKSIRKHFLQLAPSAQKSYWKELNLGKKPIEEHYRQF